MTILGSNSQFQWWHHRLNELFLATNLLSVESLYCNTWNRRRVAYLIFISLAWLVIGGGAYIIASIQKV